MRALNFSVRDSFFTRRAHFWIDVESNPLLSIFRESHLAASQRVSSTATCTCDIKRDPARAYEPHRTAPYRTVPHRGSLSGSLLVRSWYARGTLEVLSWFALSTVLLPFGTLTFF